MGNTLRDYHRHYAYYDCGTILSAKGPATPMSPRIFGEVRFGPIGKAARKAFGKSSLIHIQRQLLQALELDRVLPFTMPAWTHLIRFVAVEDGQTHLGQLVDTSRDVGLDSINGVDIKAYLINGDVFTGTVTKDVYTVSKVSSVFFRIRLRNWC